MTLDLRKLPGAHAAPTQNRQVADRWVQRVPSSQRAREFIARTLGKPADAEPELRDTLCVHRRAGHTFPVRHQLEAEESRLGCARPP